MQTPDDLRRIAALATEAAARMTQTGEMPPLQVAGLAVLLSEMQALMQVLPGTLAGRDATMPPPSSLTDAEVEAAFDNMPV